MKNILSIFVVATLILTSASCAKDYGYEVDSEVQPYFDMFEEEAAKRGIIVDLEVEGIGATIDFIRDNSTVGQCQTLDSGLRRIHIDQSFWKDYDEYGKQFIIFHELGHCYLDREHDNAVLPGGNICESIMQSGISGCTDGYGPATREEYLDELFGI